jgi:hypothetical protein
VNASGTRRRARAGLGTAIVLALLWLLTSCGGAEQPPPPSPHRVTAEEAQVLAMSRFRSFDAGSRSFTTTLASPQRVVLKGWIDYTTHTGYALAHGPDFSPQLLRWNLLQAGLRPAPADASGTPQLPMPRGRWQVRALDPSRSVLDTTLLVVADLGLDRPENPLLLRQDGALWLGERSFGGRTLTVYAAPPSDKAARSPVGPDDSGLRLWVDGSGAIHRAEIRTGADWVEVDFGDGEGVQLPRLPRLPRSAR